MHPSQATPCTVLMLGCQRVQLLACSGLAMRWFLAPRKAVDVPKSSRTPLRCTVALSPLPLEPSTPQGGFSWLGFSLFLLQPRMRVHRFAAAAVAAAQLPALSNYCQDHFSRSHGPCMAIGTVKVCLIAALPLAGVYILEGRVRRLFLDARRRADSGSPPPPLERQPSSSLVHWWSVPSALQ